MNSSYPHHIIQRGNRRQDVFFCDEDYLYYLELLKGWSKQENIEVWSYCLMSNHVHLIVCPHKHSNLNRALGEVHRRYTRWLHREKWRGYLWQGRFSSFPMEESWLLKAVSYVELNPVKVGMVAYAGGWKSYLLEAQSYSVEEFENHERTGRPLGSESFIEVAESLLGRDLRKKKPGPKINDN